MINMKLKSKCSQMFELFVCAFAVNVYIICAYVCKYVYGYVRTQMCFGISFICTYQIKSVFRFIFSSLFRKEITFAYNVKLVGKYCVRLILYSISKIHWMSVVILLTHSGLANDLSILCDVSIINFVYTWVCALIHIHSRNAWICAENEGILADAKKNTNN